MQSKVFGLFLPLIFILHNIEEFRSFAVFKEFYFKKINKKLKHKRVFFYSLVILTVFVSGICIGNYFASSQAVHLMTTLIAMAFLINGLQHCITSLWMHKVLPGTISALFLLIPSSVTYFILLEKETQFGILELISWILFSVIFMYLAIHASLWLGYLIFKQTKRLDK